MGPAATPAPVESTGGHKGSTPPKDQHKRIRILIADSTRIGCELLRAALTRDRHVEITSLCTTVHQVVAAAESAPEVALLSYDLEDGPGSGMSALRSIPDRRSTRVIMILEDSQQQAVVDSFRAGAKGIFRRSESLPRLLRCVHAVHQGQIWAGSADLNRILQAFIAPATVACVGANGQSLLTPREEQVVRLVTSGCSNHEVATQLHISDHTVKNYLFRIYDKLGVSTRVELVLYAMSRESGQD